jgi:iron complex outermembrane receptor protein
LAVSKRIIKNLWVYGSIANGFSPPTVAELFPGTVTINTTLEPEEGTNYEAGVKSSWLKNRLYMEVNAFTYNLSNAIVVRKDANNANYYVNAGSTKQKGIETQASYILFYPKSFINSGKLQLSYTHNNFHYSDFKQGTSDYSGKQLPSVAPNTVTGTFDLRLKPGIYCNLTYFYSDPIALNDANTFYASAYHLLGARLGWRKNIHKLFGINFFAGADNLLDTKYSLGNDINAAGDRYFNAAPGRNYFAGLVLKWLKS